MGCLRIREALATGREALLKDPFNSVSVADENALRVRFGQATKLGMDRAALTHSLATLAEEIEALRREEIASGFSVLVARSQLDLVTEADGSDTEYAARQRDRIAEGQTKKQALASIRQRLERVGQALETDAAALVAERAAYAHAIAAMSTIEKASAVPEVHEDAPLRLEDAVCLPELGGRNGAPSTTVSVKMLRGAISDGRLKALRPNSKNIFTTRKLIREWQESCLGQGNPLISSSAAPARMPLARSHIKPSTSSKTVLTSTARDAALTILQGLKKPSTTTSSGNTRKK